MKLVDGNQEFDGFESGEANEFDLGINQELPRDLITNFHSNQNKRPVGIEIHWAFDSLEPWGLLIDLFVITIHVRSWALLEHPTGLVLTGDVLFGLL